MLEGLLALLLVLGVVAVVGHGLWLAAAWIARGGQPAEAAPGSGAAHPALCPRCGLPLTALRCRACDWPIPINVAARRPDAALDALARQVQRATAAGVIDPQASEQLVQLIAQQRATFAEHPAAHPAARPAPPPIVEAPIEALLVEDGAKPPAAPPPERDFVSEIPLRQRAERMLDWRSQQPKLLDEPPAVPRASWTDWLAAFMEERNIRWGELVGGLLIVCCSIALVISFWSAIAARPLMKFLLFNGVTAGLFGVGFYSEYRWRLHTTSQGLLSIAGLLVPLNFLAIAAFTSASAGNNPLTIAGEVFSVALFSALVYLAGRILVGGSAAALVVGVIVPSLAQLLVRRFAGPDAGAQVLWSLAAIPLACYWLTGGWSLSRAAREPALGESETNGLFKFLGITSFAALLPLALLLVKSERPIATLHELSLAVSLLGAVPLAAGLLVWQRLAGGGLSGLRTAGTSIAVFGALVSLGGLVVGWPDPTMMLPAALVEFAVFTLVAWRFGLPAGHLVAAACLAIGYLLGVYLYDGQVDWRASDPRALGETIISGQTGALLPPLVLAYAAAAFVSLRRSGREQRFLANTADALACSSGALAAVSTALVTRFGFGLDGDPVGSAWVYLVYAAGALALAARSRRAAVAWTGAALLLAAVAQGFLYRYASGLALVRPELFAVLAYCTLSGAIATVLRVARLSIAESPLGAVLWNAAFVGSIAAAAWLMWLVPTHDAAFAARYWLWLAAVWLAVAAATGWLSVYSLAQIGLVLATIFGVGSVLEGRAWFAEARWPWLDPWTLQAVGTALLGLSLGWTALRMIARRLADHRPPASWPARAIGLLDSPWLAGDRIAAAAIVALVITIATYAALPGAGQELAPRTAASAVAAIPAAPSVRIVPPITDFELPGISHEHARQWGSWLLWGATLLVVALVAFERRSSNWLLGLLVAAAAACPLIACRFEGEVAVASALRWASAGWLLIASLPIWARANVAHLAERFGLRAKSRPPDASLCRQATQLVFVLGLVAPLAILLYVGVGALARSTRVASLPSDWFVLAILCGAAVVGAGAIWAASERLGGTANAESRPLWPKAVAALALVLGILPMLATAVYEVGGALVASPILGPDPSSIFIRMGLAGCYGVPILVTAVVLVGYALRERSSAFGLAGGLVLNAAATTGYLLALPAGSRVFDAAQWIRLAELNATVAALFTMAWLATTLIDRRRRGRGTPIEGDFLLGTQVALAPALLLLVLGWAWCDLVANPQGHLSQTQVMNAELADAAGWISLTLAALAAGAAARAAGRRLSMAGLSAGFVALAIMAAAVAGRHDIGNWLAYNTLFVGHMAIVALLLAIAWHDRRRALASHEEWIAGSASAIWPSLARAAVLLLALRELNDNRWWTVAALAVLAASGAAAGWIYQRRRYLYDAAIMVNAAGSIAWLESNVLPGFENFVLANVILLALPVVGWLAIERFRIAGREFQPRFQAAPAHRVATRLAIFVLALVAGGGLYRDAAQRSPLDVAGWMPWAALVATTIAALACLWDARSRDAVARLYVLGLVAAAVLLDGFNLAPSWLLWTGNMVVAAYALATSYLWSRREGLRVILDRLRIPHQMHGELAGLEWLVPCNLLLVAMVVLLTGIIELAEHDVSLRVLASQALLTQVASVALLARGDRRGLLQSIALAVGAGGAVMLGWSWLIPGATGTLLHGLVVMAAALSGVAAFYGLALGKLLRASSDWLAPARRITPRLAALVAASIVAILAIEIYQFSRAGAVDIAWPAILAVALTLGGLCAAALAAAVLPGRDPLNMSERGRTLYVYGAEVLLALLCFHVRITMPWLFSGFFQQYWPLIVMGIAFAGVGFAELCRRYRQQVLAGPMENTGAFLPVLPVLGFWAADTRVDYSLLLLTVGVLYAGLSIARRSFGFGVLAALAANGGLWFFLNRQDGFGFLIHPQIWLIPPALCVLAAAYLNRSQLSDAQMTTVRYFTSMSIYVSSTADIFLNGVAQAPWLPAALAGLSVAGILAGIALRVRAFLLLGTCFLALALFTVIWYAAVDRDQTWVWYASGIIAGALIIVLFAIFEKKRQEVLEAFERIKQWEA